MGAQQRRKSRSSSIYITPEPGPQQTGSPVPAAGGRALCCTTSWGLISSTISLQRACPCPLHSSCCGFCLPDQSRAQSNQPAPVPQEAGISLLWDGAQGPSSQSCRLSSAGLRTRANQLPQAEHPLLIPCFCTPGSKHCFWSPTQREQHPLFPTDEATAAKFTISRLFCLQNVKNLQEAPALAVLIPVSEQSRVGSSRTGHNTQSLQTDFASHNK